MSTRRRPATVTLVKDLILFAVGLVLIFDQAFFVRPEDFNPYLTALGAVLVGVPGAVQLLAPRTDGPSTSEEPEQRPSPSRSSSRGRGADR